jgi:hypothetical protein
MYIVDSIIQVHKGHKYNYSISAVGKAKYSKGKEIIPSISFKC